MRYNKRHMIRYITGTVLGLAPHGLVIQTGGLGYHVYTTKKIMALPGELLSLHTYLAVRETALDLYGFVLENELALFEILLTIPKIGPKSALQILDQADVALITESVTLQDPEHLTKQSGIGKKTAEKIVLALKDKLDHLMIPTTANPSSLPSSTYRDVFDTLLTLGYNPAAIRQALEQIDETASTSDLVKQALQKIS